VGPVQGESCGIETRVVGDITRSFDIHAKPVRWLGFFIDCRLDWRTDRLALGAHQIPEITRVMQANSIPQKLARKSSMSAVVISTTAYGIEAIWEGQGWLPQGLTDSPRLSRGT
jgi:hypothetical protein